MSNVIRRKYMEWRWDGYGQDKSVFSAVHVLYDIIE